MNVKLLVGVLAVVIAVLIGLPSANFASPPAGQTWSMVVHFAYQDGTEYDYIFARGVSTRELSSYLAECGASHWTGSVVRYHCYPIPE
jgi:hypothetical protein